MDPSPAVLSRRIISAITISNVSAHSAFAALNKSPSSVVWNWTLTFFWMWYTQNPCCALGKSRVTAASIPFSRSLKKNNPITIADLKGGLDKEQEPCPGVGFLTLCNGHSPGEDLAIAVEDCHDKNDSAAGCLDMAGVQSNNFCGVPE